MNLLRGTAFIATLANVVCFPENCDTILHNATVWGMRQRPTEKEFQTWAYKSEITEGKTELSLSYKSPHLPPGHGASD